MGYLPQSRASGADAWLNRECRMQFISGIERKHHEGFIPVSVSGSGGNYGITTGARSKEIGKKGSGGERHCQDVTQCL
jgi:hypothetical protein